MTDLILAIIHHLLVFSLAAIIATELATVRNGLAGVSLRRLGTVDLFYGVIAAGVLVVGFLRVFLGAKGPAAYLPNPFFWGEDQCVRRGRPALDSADRADAPLAAAGPGRPRFFAGALGRALRAALHRRSGDALSTDPGLRRGDGQGLRIGVTWAGAWRRPDEDPSAAWGSGRLPQEPNRPYAHRRRHHRGRHENRLTEDPQAFGYQSREMHTEHCAEQ